jgi:hypothetical protein
MRWMVFLAIAGCATTEPHWAPKTSDDPEPQIGYRGRRRKLDGTACFARAAERLPGLRGRVVLDLDLGADGQVVKRTVTEWMVPDDPDLTSCLAAMEKIAFPPSRSAAPVHVRTHIVWEPTDEVIRAVISSHARDNMVCAERHGFSKGRATRAVTIGPDGAVIDAAIENSTFASPALEACLAERARTWRFPSLDGSEPRVIRSGVVFAGEDGH